MGKPADQIKRHITLCGNPKHHRAPPPVWRSRLWYPEFYSKPPLRRGEGGAQRIDHVVRDDETVGPVCCFQLFFVKSNQRVASGRLCATFFCVFRAAGRPPPLETGGTGFSSLQAWLSQKAAPPTHFPCKRAPTRNQSPACSASDI